MRRSGALGMSTTASALVALCRREVSLRDVAAAKPELREPEFQAGLAALAQRHGLFGLMLDTLARGGGWADLPADVAEGYRGALRQLRLQAALWDLERDFVLSLLAAKGIPTVLLKGSALRLMAYPDPVQRPFGDLDVLVPEGATDQAVAVLGEAGYRGDAEQRARLYREHHHHLILRKALGFIVEVHWALEPVRSPFLLDPEAFRRDARTLTTAGGVPVRVPSAEHCVLHLSTQSMEDGFSRLGRLVDLDRIIATAGAEFAWPWLCAEAVRMRVNAVAALSLRLAQLLFATPLPAGVFDALELGGVARANLALLDPIGLVLEQRSQRHGSLSQLLLLWSVSDRRTRLAVLRAMHAGEQDWFVKLAPAAAGAATGKRRSPAVATLKLALYQLWVYLSAITARRRARRFWTLPIEAA